MDAKEKSFELVTDTSKLLMTLATGFITISVSFSETVKELLETQTQKWFWSLFWVFMLISIVFGVWTLLGLTTVLEPKNNSTSYKPSIRNPQIKSPFAIQLLAMATGFIFLVVFGLLKISKP